MWPNTVERRGLSPTIIISPPALNLSRDFQERKRDSLFAGSEGGGEGGEGGADPQHQFVVMGF